jgi:hypothetical protein
MIPDDVRLRQVSGFSQHLGPIPLSTLILRASAADSSFGYTIESRTVRTSNL